MQTQVTYQVRLHSKSLCKKNRGVRCLPGGCKYNAHPKLGAGEHKSKDPKI